MTTEAQRMAVRRYKDKLIALGWCAHCFVTQDLETQRLCQRCAEMNRERARNHVTVIQKGRKRGF